MVALRCMLWVISKSPLNTLRVRSEQNATYVWNMHKVILITEINILNGKYWTAAHLISTAAWVGMVCTVFVAHLTWYLAIYSNFSIVFSTQYLTAQELIHTCTFWLQPGLVSYSCCGNYSTSSGSHVVWWGTQKWRALSRHCSGQPLSQLQDFRHSIQNKCHLASQQLTF